MHAGLPREVVHGEAQAKFDIQLFSNAPQPERRDGASFRLAGHQSQQFRQPAFHLQIACVERRARLEIAFEAEL